jgi:hypothetical protein
MKFTVSAAWAVRSHIVFSWASQRSADRVESRLELRDRGAQAERVAGIAEMRHHAEAAKGGGRQPCGSGSRFSLHYALLQPSSERQASYRRAMDLYDARSRLAHGGTLRKRIPFGDEKISEADLARYAAEMLRATIQLFLHEGRSPSFARKNYWQERYFEAAAPPQRRADRQRT